MKLIDSVDKRLGEIFKEYEKEDVDVVSELMKESGYKEEEIRKEGISKNFSSSFFSFLCGKLYEIGLEKNKLINILYLIKHISRREYVYIGEKGRGEGKGYKEIYPGIILHKEIFYHVLDKLGLNKTKEAYINYLIINEEETREDLYLSKEQIEKFKRSSVVNDILEIEYKEKLVKKPRIIKL